MSKLQLGKNKTTTAFFDSCVVIHANFEPYAISLLAEPNANIGLVTALVPDIKEFLEPIRSSQRCAAFREPIRCPPIPGKAASTRARALWLTGACPVGYDRLISAAPWGAAFKNTHAFIPIPVLEESEWWSLVVDRVPPARWCSLSIAWKRTIDTERGYHTV